MQPTHDISARVPPHLSSLYFAFLLTVAFVAADQIASPTLRTTSTLWASAAFLLLVWRREGTPLSTLRGARQRSVLGWRFLIFLAMHLVLVLLSRLPAGTVAAYAGTATLKGTLVGVGRLTVLAPTIVLLPLSLWRQLLRAYKTEAIAAILVLTINVPRRVLEFVWPWYGRVFAWSVYMLARSFVPGLSYGVSPEPVIFGPYQDLVLIRSCSGIDAFELLAYLFGLVALLDWNRLRKSRALLIYSGCLAFLLICNIGRIATLVILFNRGYTDLAASFHLTAGSIFFCSIFLVYMALTYRWMTNRHHLSKV